MQPSKRIYVLPVEQLQASHSRLQVLARSDPRLAGALHKIRLGSCTQIAEQVGPLFEALTNEPTRCQNKITSSYVCVTCNQSKAVKICEDCFSEEDHRGHNYYTQADSGVSCQCSTAGENICRKHTRFQGYQDYKKPHPATYPYISFIAQLLEYLISIPFTDWVNRMYSQVFNLMGLLNKSSLAYNIASTYVFGLPNPLQKDQRILAYLMLQRFQNLSPSNCLIVLLQEMCSYEPFQIMFMQSYNQSRTYLGAIYCIYKNLVSRYHVVAYLVRNNMLANQFASGSFLQTVRDLVEHGCSAESRLVVTQIMKQTTKANKISSLSWREPMKNFKAWKQLFIIISQDYDLAKHVITGQLSRVYQISQFKENYEMIDQTLTLALYAVDGDYQSARFYDLFAKVDTKSLTGFVKAFFQQVLMINFKVKFSHVNAMCMLSLIRKFQLQNHIREIPLRAATCLKFTQKLLIVLRNLVSEHFMTQMLFHIHRNEGRGDAAMREKYEAEVLEWLNDYLFSLKIIPNEYLVSLYKSGIIDFDAAKKLILSLTEKNKDGRIYIGPDRQFKPWMMLNLLKFGHQFSQIVYRQPLKFKVPSAVKQILLMMFEPNILTIEVGCFKNLNTKDQYLVCSTAILLQQFTDRQSSTINQYIIKLREVYMKVRFPSQTILKVLDLMDHSSKYQQKIRQVENFEENVMKELQSAKKIQQREENFVIITPVKQETQEKKFVHLTPENQAKRNNKINKLKQKFSRKSTKYLHHIKQSKQVQQQVCLVCRESHLHHKNFILYLGNISNNGNLKLGHLLGQSTYFKSCLHPYHDKCLNKLSTRKCILCQFEGNCIVPALSSSPASELFTYAWWTNFENLPSFEPVKAGLNYGYANYYGYYQNSYGNQNQVQNQKETNPVVSSAKSNEHQYLTNFMAMFKNCVLKIGPALLGAKWETELNRIKYFVDLLKFYYTRLTKPRKQKIKEQIKKFEEETENKNLSKIFVKDLIFYSSCVMSLAIREALQPEQETALQQSISKFARSYPLTFSQNFIRVTENLLGVDLQIPQSQITDQLTNQDIGDFFYVLKLPDTIADLQALSSPCQTCRSISTCVCLICGARLCEICHNTREHRNKQHEDSIIHILNCRSGQINEISNYPKSHNLYFNEITSQAFDRETEKRSLVEFKIDRRVTNSLLSKIFNF